MVGGRMAEQRSHQQMAVSGQIYKLFLRGLELKSVSSEILIDPSYLDLTFKGEKGSLNEE